MFGKFLPSRGGVWVGEPNPGYLVLTTLEGEGEITRKYQPVVVLDHQDLTQETLAVLRQSALVVGNLESVVRPSFRVIVTVLRSAKYNISKGGDDISDLL